MIKLRAMAAAALLAIACAVVPYGSAALADAGEGVAFAFDPRRDVNAKTARQTSISASDAKRRGASETKRREARGETV